MHNKTIQYIRLLVVQAQEEIQCCHLQVQDYGSCLHTKKLDEVFVEIKQILDLRSEYLDLDELESDLESLEYYYQKRSWNNVSRWLSNIDATLQEIFRCEIEYLHEPKNKRKPLWTIEYSSR